MIDTVGMPLWVAEKQLAQAQLCYSVTETCPVRKVSELDRECYYVVRQQIRNEEYDLTVAAKMRKNVN